MRSTPPQLVAIMSSPRSHSGHLPLLLKLFLRSPRTLVDHDVPGRRLRLGSTASEHDPYAKWREMVQGLGVAEPAAPALFPCAWTGPVHRYLADAHFATPRTTGSYGDFHVSVAEEAIRRFLPADTSSLADEETPDDPTNLCYLRLRVELDLPVPVRLAVVVETHAAMPGSTAIDVAIRSNCVVVWPEGIPGLGETADHNRIGESLWKIRLDDYDWRIDASGEQLREGLPRPMVDYRLLSAPAEVSKSPEKPRSIQPAGVYVFVVSVLLPATTPELATTPYGQLTHTLAACGTQFPLTWVKAAPNPLVSTMDKPIYVNKVWNGVLGYELTFPHKYVSLDLSSVHELGIRLMPLEKNIVVKRVRVNITEKITYYASRGGEGCQYTVPAKQYPGYVPTSAHRSAKDRTVCLYEVCAGKAPKNSKGAPPMCLETVGEAENLLSGCFGSSDGLVSPIEMEIPVGFVHADASRRVSIAGSVVSARKGSVSSVSSAHAPVGSPPSSFLAVPHLLTLPSRTDNHSPFGGLKNRIRGKQDTVDLAVFQLYPDVSNRFMKVLHRLQVAFRVLRMEQSVDPSWHEGMPERLRYKQKMHHYEVMIDSPIVLMNSVVCDDQLPKYTDLGMFRSVNFGKVQIRPYEPPTDPGSRNAGEEPAEWLPSFEVATLPAVRARSESVFLGLPLPLMVPLDMADSRRPLVVSDGFVNLDDVLTGMSLLGALQETAQEAAPEEAPPLYMESERLVGPPGLAAVRPQLRAVESVSSVLTNASDATLGLEGVQATQMYHRLH